MNSKEAREYIENGGVVFSGGYTYFKGGYFSYGTYPGCIRGGSVNPEEHPDDWEWEALTEKDIVCRNGYKPCQFVKPLMQDGTVNFERLDEYISKRILVCDWSNPMINSKICKEYFSYE